MKEVKNISSIAKASLNLPKPEDWKEAKKQLDSMQFPQDNDLGWKEILIHETHTKGKNTHKLTTYHKWFSILNYEGEAKYNRCSECAKTRNAVLRLYNNEINQCYEKLFVYQGRDAEGKDLKELVKGVFGVLVLLLIN